MYNYNFLNGADFPLVHFSIVAQTGSPVTTIPASLVPYSPYIAADATVNRTLVFDTITLVPGSVPNLAEGPFGINHTTFDMDSVNIVVPLNSTEIWTLKNNTHIAHPFHIHDIQFNILEKSGAVPPVTEQGWKDVVLVMPHDSAKFITKFTTFSDEMTPYMYHCHLLHHEDDGMMGSFLVIDPFMGLEEPSGNAHRLTAFPNPSAAAWQVTGDWNGETMSGSILTSQGQLVRTERFSGLQPGDTIRLDANGLEEGIYFLIVEDALGNRSILRLETIH
jgi:blue copper oxidase